MSTWIRAAAIAGAVLVVSGCVPRSVSAVATIELPEASEAERQQAAAILKARFEALVGSYTASITPSLVANGVRIEFRGEPPPDEMIRRYGAAQGVMRITSQRSRLVSIVTDQDVESASVYSGAQGPMVQLVLTERAGQRMLDYTGHHQGETLLTTWDGGEPSGARIAGVFGREFQTTGMDRDTAMMRAIVLRHGRLPKAVKSVTIDHPAR